MERSRYISAEVWKIIIIAATCQLLEDVLYKPTYSFFFLNNNNQHLFGIYHAPDTVVST